ncbi:MAG: hypothetical protein J6A58_10255, partial [Oscillospiraceae bacterium]|nr:hypothetical protein [Oscillospiraceae bacterium]
MSRKFRKVVASTLAIAMMAGTATYLPADPYSIIQAAEAGPTVSISKDLKAKAGEEFTFTVDISNNTSGYSSLIAWLDIDLRYFEFVSWKAGDPSASGYNRTPQKQNTANKEYTKPGTTDVLTLLQTYIDNSAQNLTGDNVYATITLRVKENTPDGVYPLAFDAQADGKAMCNHVVREEGQEAYPIVLEPTYVNGSITVGNGGTAVTTSATQQTPQQTQQTQQTPQQTQATQQTQSTTAAPVINQNAMNFVLGNTKVNAGETAYLALDIKNNSGLSAFQGELILPSGFKCVKGYACDFEGSWSISEGSANVQFLSVDGHNIATSDGMFGEFEIAVPAGTADGVYEVYFTNLSASNYTGSGQQVYDPSKLAGVKGTITVGNGGVTVTQQTPSTQATTTTAKPSTTQAPQSGQFTVGVANASGTVGSNVKTTLDITGNPGIAGFTADLSYDTSALQFVSASAAGNWDIEVSADGKQIVAIANPYADVTTTGKAVELTFKPLTAGSHTVKVSSVEGAKKNETAVAGTGTAGTITVTGGNSSDIPGSDDKPAADAMQFVLGNVKANAGETAYLSLDIKNNKGLSAFQGELILPEGFDCEKGYACDFEGSWSISEGSANVQFLSVDGHNIATSDGMFGEFEVKIPAGTPDGVYEVYFTNLAASNYTGSGQSVYDSSKLAGVKGTITVGNGGSTVTQPTSQVTTTNKPSSTTQSELPPAADAMQFILGNAKANAGEKAYLALDIKNNIGLSAFQTELILPEGFNCVKGYACDFEGSWSISEGSANVQFLSVDGHNIATTDGMFGEFEIEIPAGTPDGVYEVYLKNLDASNYTGSGQTVYDPSKLAGVKGTITVGKGGSVSSATTTTAKPVTTTQAPSNPPTGSTTVNSGSPSTPGEVGPTVAISNGLKANAGEEFTFTVDITNNTKGYSSLIAWLDIDTRYFELVSWKAGDPTADGYNRTPQKQNTANKEYTKPGSTNILTL